MDSQCKLILNHLQTHRGITQKEAVELYGCYRLSARIYDLRDMGYKILTNVREVTNRYGKTSRFAEYVLIESLKDFIL